MTSFIKRPLESGENSLLEKNSKVPLQKFKASIKLTGISPNSPKLAFL